MSFSPNSALIANHTQHFRCQQHAARTYVDEQFRLLPKTKFLYHVSFNVNWKVLSTKNVSFKLLQTLKDEINLLVKATDLPAYVPQHEVLNQYNRTKVVQYRHKYNDIGMTFHDDNMGLVNQLWQAYYRYHYADPTVSNTKGAYNKTAMQDSSHIKVPYGYTGRVAPFFNYITIYQMSRHEYVSYKLINPVIVSWNGNRLSYADGNSHTFDLKFAYEAVYYDMGYVNSGDIEGFGAVHYDWSPSTLTTNWPTNVSTSPAFPNTKFGSTDLGVVYSDNTVAQNPINTLNTYLYQQVVDKASPGVQGVTVPQASSGSDTTTATAVNPGQATATTPATTGAVPDYAANL